MKFDHDNVRVVTVKEVKSDAVMWNNEAWTFHATGLTRRVFVNADRTKVIKVHGELLKACSSMNKELTVEWKGDINIGDKHADGSQLRPFIVWFGESVPLIEYAGEEVKSADILVVCGTSLQVYPAAGLMNHARYGAKRFYIDPSPDYGILPNSVSVIPKIASEGMLDFIETLQDN